MQGTIQPTDTDENATDAADLIIPDLHEETTENIENLVSNRIIIQYCSVHCCHTMLFEN